MRDKHGGDQHGRYTHQHRLTQASDFKRLFDNAYKTSGGGLTVLARRHSGPYPRLGLIISKKCAKTAVARNRLKRVVRESFRGHQDILAGMDIVVIGQSGVEQRSNAEIRTTLERHWTRLKQWKDS